MRLNSRKDAPESHEFSPQQREAWANYPRVAPATNFNAQVLQKLEQRKRRYRGFGGWCLRLAESEIEGVALWRLALSSAGGASCFGIVLMLGIGRSSPVPLPPVPLQLPDSQRIALATSPFYARMREDAPPRPRKTAPKPVLPLPQGDELSWRGLNDHLA